LDSSCDDDEQDDDDDSTMEAVVSHNDVNNNNLFVTRPTSPDGSITAGMPPLVNNRRESITSHVGVKDDYDLGSSGSQHQPLFLRQQQQAYEYVSVHLWMTPVFLLLKSHPHFFVY
jgi:hypothetical protein